MPPETALPFQAGAMAPGGAPGLPAGLPKNQSRHATALATAQFGVAPNRTAARPPSWRPTSWRATVVQLVSLTPPMNTATLAQPRTLGLAASSAVASPSCGRATCETTPHGLR